MIDKSEQMTVFVASPCKGGVPRSQSLQNDFRRRKKSFLHLIWMITFLEFDYTIPIKVSILRLKDRRKQQSSLWPITKTLKYDYYHLASVSRGFWGLIRVISYHNPWFTYLKYRNVWLLQLQKFQYILAFITLHKYNLPREDTVAAGSL